MIEEVKTCADAKINYFGEYFTVPDSLQPELDRFIQDTEALGERCGSAAEFEREFSAAGLSERFNTLLSQCMPKARKMTREEKQQSWKTTKDILRENRGDLAKDVLSEAASSVRMQVEDEMIQESRKRMIEDGTLTDHTIRRNRREAVGSLIRFLGDQFKKKH